MSEFTVQQLATARAAAWHQSGDALLTLESLRAWLDRFGLVLFVPRPLQIPAPAPSFVEATLGAAHAAPTLAQIEEASGLLARLVEENAAVPLNLLGGVGDQPDFVVSAKLFSFIFTLRGDKSWKQPPSTAGSTSVSPLALNAYQLLAERGEMTTSELTHELGREVTEAAVLRSLCELWGHLRVLSVPQAGGAETKWDLATKRFTKQIKAGVNAGQPTALSALISVYLAQAIAAAEEEIEVFLSPLIARSRIREVANALLSARQLESVVLEGKTLLHVAGELPEFAAEPPAEQVAIDAAAQPETQQPETQQPETQQPETQQTETQQTETQQTETAAEPSRIRKFGSAPRSTSSPRSTSRSTGASRSTGFSRPDADKERRPFRRERPAEDRPRPSFTKPWDEEKRESRPAAEGEAPKPRKSAEGGWKPTRSFGDKPQFGRGEGRPPRRDFSDRPKRDFGDRPPRKPFGDRPKFGSDREGRPPRRDFNAGPPRERREGSAAGEKRPFERRERPAAGAGRPAGRPTSRPFERREDSRPPRKPFGDRPKFGGDREGRPPRREFGDRDSRPPRREFGDRESRPPRREFGDREGFKPRSRPAGASGDRPSFPRRDKPASAGGEARPFRRFEKREGGAGGEEKRPFRKPGFKPGGPGGFAKRPGGDRERGPSAGRPRPEGGTRFGSRPGGDSSGKRFGGKSFGDRPAGKRFGGKPGGFAGKKPGGSFGGPRKPRPRKRVRARLRHE